MQLLPIFFFFLFFQFGFAQEIPPVVSYHAEDYSADNQNWSITQSDEGWIYIANNKGLLSFNGERWNLYDSPNQSIIRSVHAIDHRIYTGCFREFGYWEKDQTGKLFYTSISEGINLKEDEQFWKIIDYKNWIIFQSLNSIYLYHTQRDEVKKIDPPKGITKVFEVNGKIYFSQPGEGIFQIKNAEPQLVNNHPFFKENLIINIYSINNQLLVQTDKDGIYTLEEKPQRHPSFEFDFLSNVDVYNSHQTSNGDVVLGTISNGVYRISSSGEIIYHINRKNGLANNTVLSLFEDEDENMWLGLDNGISLINTHSPVKTYTDETGRLGTVYVSKLIGDLLYLGTNQGLFYKNQNTPNAEFELIKGSAGQVWQLFEYDGQLFCGHNNGTFLVEDNQISKISSKLGTWNFKTIPGRPNLLLQGNYFGFSVLAKIDGQWGFRNSVDGFDVSSKSFEFLDDFTVLVDHEYKGVYRLEFDEDYENIIQQTKDNSVEKGLYSSLIKFQHQIFYANKNGIYVYQPKEKKFALHAQIGDLLNNDTFTTGRLVKTSEEDFFLFTKKFTYRISNNSLDNSLLLEAFPITNSMRSSLVGYENVTKINNDVYLFGSHSGYLTLNLSLYNKFQRPLLLSINDVTSSNLEGTTNTLSLFNDTPPSLDYSMNTVEFGYGVPLYTNYLNIEYQYKLEGLFEDWSDWSSKSSVKFSNLNFGNYRFYVRARMGNNIASEDTVYEFKVDRPFLLSNPMLALYLVSLVIIIFIIHNAYKIYYKRQKRLIYEQNQRKIRLQESENERRLIEIKNQKLESEIESKNRELAVSTMSLIKKNEFLNQLQSELKKYEGQPKKGVQQVSKIINKKLNQNDDWEFFEKAFNNADQDFFKKIKERHPDLTPNDLKLCAYLRLNLSSKEIAPLFNISTKSVEVKRYRLRKKMGLDRDTSLTNYILEL